jgi:HK97 family phage major capsid protein
MRTAVRLTASEEGIPDDGFRSLGDFLVAVRRATTVGPIDTRLTRATAGASEVDPAGGGFLVPEVYATSIIGSIYEASVLAPLCDVTEVTGPLGGLSEPAFDETSRQDGSRWGGSLGYWLAESASVPLTRPKFRKNRFTPHKLVLISQMTNELFDDTNMLAAHFERAMVCEGAFKLDAAILTGAGVGLPLGIVNAPCTISVPKEMGQVAATITGNNISSMWSRLSLPSRRQAVWLVNEDVDSQLETIGNASGTALYVPQGAAGNPYPLLKGRPVLAVEQAQPLGTVGDIVLADLSLYRIVQAAPRFAMSADVGFDTDEMVFRFSLRLDGKPAYASPITPYNGSNTTRSPFIVLAAR